MKRIFLLLSLLPAMSACTVENDYYANDYRYQAPPRAEVERPYYPRNRYYGSSARGYHGHSSNNYRGHSNNEIVVQTPGNNRPEVQIRNNTHGHPSQENEVIVQVPSNNRSGRVHGHT